MKLTFIGLVTICAMFNSMKCDAEVEKSAPSKICDELATRISSANENADKDAPLVAVPAAEIHCDAFVGNPPVKAT